MENRGIVQAVKIEFDCRNSWLNFLCTIKNLDSLDLDGHFSVILSQKWSSIPHNFEIYLHTYSRFTEMVIDCDSLQLICNTCEFSTLNHTDEEEQFVSDAYGVKMRGTHSISPRPSRSATNDEDDLKWVEENIPAAIADAALPVLDSDEEMVNTKFEVSKMQ